jgi:glutathione synthase
VRIGIAISSASAARPEHTTVHIAQAAVEVGHEVRVFEPWDFEVDPRGQLSARGHVVGATASREDLAGRLTARSLARRSVRVDRLDVLLLRMNPMDNAVVTFGQLVQAAGVDVRNDPRGMLRYTHKAWLAALPDVPRPRTLVTRSPSAVATFSTGCQEGIVVKPARSCGGRAVAIFRGRRRPGLELAVEEAAAAGDGYVVAQEYLPAASLGEKRLVWLDGDLIGAYLRMRGPGELRHNLKVGGEPHPCTIDAADHRICASLTPHLRREGVWLAGIDVIGGLVVEVNALNPGGLHWGGHFTGTSLGGRVVASLTPGSAVRVAK